MKPSPSSRWQRAGFWLLPLWALSLVILPEQALWAKKKKPKKTIAVVTLPAKGVNLSVARRVRRQLLKAFAKDTQAVLFDPLKTLRVPLSGEPPSFMPLMDQGKEALQQRQYRQAMQHFSQAIKIIEPALAFAPKAALSDAMLHLAAAEAGVGRYKQALQTLQDLLTWRPHHPLVLPGHYPSGWRELATEAQKWLAIAPQSSIQIKSTPSHAEAFIDGRRLGATPTMARDLVIGTHYLTLHCEGYERLVIPIQVKDQETAISVRMEPDAEASAFIQNVDRLRSSLGKPHLPTPEDVAAAAGTPHMLFVVIQGTRSTLELKAYLYDLQQNKLLSEGILDTGRPIKIAHLSPLKIWGVSGQGDTTDKTVPGAGSSSSWYKKWWVWTIAGTIVVAGAGLAVILPRTLGDESSGEIDRLQLHW